MGFFDKVKEIISENDDDDFDEYYDDAEASFEKSSKNNVNIFYHSLESV